MVLVPAEWWTVPLLTSTPRADRLPVPLSVYSADPEWPTYRYHSTSKVPPVWVNVAVPPEPTYAPEALRFPPLSSYAPVWTDPQGPLAT